MARPARVEIGGGDVLSACEFRLRKLLRAFFVSIGFPAHSIVVAFILFTMSRFSHGCPVLRFPAVLHTRGRPSRMGARRTPA